MGHEPRSGSGKVETPKEAMSLADILMDIKTRGKITRTTFMEIAALHDRVTSFSMQSTRGWTAATAISRHMLDLATRIWARVHSMQIVSLCTCCNIYSAERELQGDATNQVARDSMTGATFLNIVDLHDRATRYSTQSTRGWTRHVQDLALRIQTPVHTIPVVSLCVP